MQHWLKSLGIIALIIPGLLPYGAAGANEQMLYEARTAMELGDYAMAARVYEELLDQGVAAAALPLARIHWRKLIPLARPQRAFSLIRKAATGGYAPAQARLGYLYENGQGVGKDYKHAWYWYVQASGAEDPEGITGIGRLYQYGRGVEQDHGTALKWYDRAARQDYAPAQHALGFMHEQGLGTRQDLAAAMAWYREAARQEYTPSMNILGFMHEMGYGTRINYRQALHWFRLSATHGDPV